MSLKGQSLGQVQINRMKANARCIIFDNGNIPSAAYAALGEVNLGLVPIKDLNTCLSKIDKTTRLVVLAGAIQPGHTWDVLSQGPRHAIWMEYRDLPHFKEFEDRVLAARTRTRLDADICIPQSAPTPVISEHLSRSHRHTPTLESSRGHPTRPRLSARPPVGAHPAM